MKFVSKNANLGVVLKPGLPGNAQLGTTTTPGIYARFKDGMLEVTDPTMVEMMLKHPANNVDFIAVEENAIDPYAGQRQSSEPTHIISEMKGGQPNRVTKSAVNMTPEMKAALMEIATEMAKPMAINLAKTMLPSMVEETLKALAEQGADKAVESPVVKKAGRPKKSVETGAT